MTIPLRKGTPFAEALTRDPGPYKSALTALGFHNDAGIVNGPDRAVHIMIRDQARFHVSAVRGTGRAAAWVEEHGDGIADVALQVPDVRAAFARAVAAGAEPIRPPETRPHINVPPLAVIGGPGVWHTLTQIPSPADPRRSKRTRIDHVALAVAAADLNDTAAFYSEGLGFRYEPAKRIVIGAQGLDSGVLYGEGIAITLVSPDPTRLPGQVDEFLAANHGPGIQHVAFDVGGICQEVRDAAAAGIRFLPTPGTYYRALPDRLGYKPDDLADLESTSVLLDIDIDAGGGSGDQASLGERREVRQIFTGAIAWPSLGFFELISRTGGARTFGKRNIAALFDAKQRAGSR